MIALNDHLISPRKDVHPVGGVKTQNALFFMRVQF